MNSWDSAIAECPLIAILRGIGPDEAQSVADVLYESGFRVLEVPLNSPSPLESIRRIRVRLDGSAIVGAGTVLSAKAVSEVAAAGAQVVISPNTNLSVIEATKGLGLVSLPAFFTPTEAFTALGAGASALKFFPAEAGGPGMLKSMMAVLPQKTAVFAVGGVEPSAIGTFYRAGAAGFGIGSSLYQAGKTLEAIRSSALGFVNAWREASTLSPGSSKGAR